jgi:hypothetical protein
LRSFVTCRPEEDRFSSLSPARTSQIDPAPAPYSAPLIANSDG